MLTKFTGGYPLPKHSPLQATDILVTSGESSHLAGMAGGQDSPPWALLGKGSKRTLQKHPEPQRRNVGQQDLATSTQISEHITSE